MQKLNSKEQGYAKLRDPAFVNELAKTIHVDNVARGWYDSPRSSATLLQLCVTELAEATEGLRKNLMDDKLPHRLMEEVEQADFIIRLLDFCAHKGLSIKFSNIIPIGKRMEACKCYLTCAAWLNTADDWLYDAEDDDIKPTRADEMISYASRNFSMAYAAIINLAEHKGYDIYEAMREKLEFNAVRNDHTREHRANENGKKF